MANETVLVTGGAGFIGSHLVDALLARGAHVRVLDNLTEQVHGPGQQRPAYLAPGAELIVGDVADPATVARALDGVDVVLHQAAAVGVAQSQYDPVTYVRSNALGTATLLAAILAQEPRRVRKLIVASSMSNYGEGRYHCPNHGPIAPPPRPDAQLAAREWEVRCPLCQAVAAPRPTDEAKPLAPTTVYAISKRDQEELVLTFGQAHGLPVVALRYFGVYGPRQALSNPYTGVGAIFSSRILAGKPPLVYEDGGQSRDLVHVSDVVRANLLAMDSPAADGEVLNVGTGRATSIKGVAELLIARLAPNAGLQPRIAGQFRSGDIRHCYADIGKIQDKLGYAPRVPLGEGVADLVAWVAEQTPSDRTAQAFAELDRYRLVR